MMRLPVDATESGSVTAAAVFSAVLAVVTGAAAGIGRETAVALAKMDQWAAFLDGETETATKVVSIGSRRKRP